MICMDSCDNFPFILSTVLSFWIHITKVTLGYLQKLRTTPFILRDYETDEIYGIPLKMATEDPEITPWPVVCAIDFGTTFSGYAYSMRADYERNPLNIESNPAWFNEGQGTLKAPTCILFDKAGKFHSFGYEAERKYASLAERAQENEEDENVDEDDDEDDNESEDEKRNDKPLEDDFNDWLFLRRFKMKLFQDASVRRRQKLKNLKLEAENGKKVPAMKVFSEAIRFLKHHFEGLLEKTILRHDDNTSTPATSADDSKESENDSDSSQKSDISKDILTKFDKTEESTTDTNTPVRKQEDSSWSADILWVLTVPAIWSDEAKQFMREAAIQAGIDDDHLVLALEPESAALLCKQLALKKGANDINVRMFDPGSKFMVVDCGGGTVDVTAYEVKDKSLKELHCASGDALGGTNVDELFIGLLNDIFGKDVVNRFKNKSPSDWLELLRSFEAMKRGIGQENSNQEKSESITFSNIGDLFKEFKKANKKLSIASKLQDMNLKDKIRPLPKKSKLRFNEDYLIETVFNGPITATVNHLQELFTNKQVAEIDIILLVGEFSECTLLQKAVRTQFPNKNIINPREGSIDAMKGAVLFGHSPENMIRKSVEQGLQVSSIFTEGIIRKSKAYYGVATDVPFLEDEHPLNHKFLKEDGEVVCTDVFDCMIEKNQELEIGKTVIEKTFGSSTSWEANVEIYRSNSEVRYCTDDECKRIGQISAVFSTENDSKRLFKIQLHFGFTEKIATAIDLSTNRKWKAKLNCLL